MCTMPRVPPPPPPLLLQDPDSSPKTLKIGETNEIDIDPAICQWASLHPELREACVRNGICVNKPPYKHSYKRFETILQIGPTCGLVALSMLVNGEATPDELLNIAKLEGYTSNGEMFSCKDMMKLSEKVHSLTEISNVRCELKCGGLFSTETVKRLLNGAVLLVPYDADCNHSPCLKNGHTAHWALICGVMVVAENPDGVTNYEDDPKNVYVLCKHGKSRHLTIWNLFHLAKSNSNLWEFSPKKGADGLVYILPVGGIGGVNGLRDQFLIFENV